jgi:hypothetical protein
MIIKNKDFEIEIYPVNLDIKKQTNNVKGEIAIKIIKQPEKAEKTAFLLVSPIINPKEEYDKTFLKNFFSKEINIDTKKKANGTYALHIFALKENSHEYRVISSASTTITIIN